MIHSLLLAAALSHPNILLILIDDIGNDKIGVYQEGPAAEQPPTPNIDALAASGLRFTNFWSHPTCSPTRASIFTGLHPHQHGLGHALGQGEIHPSLDFELPTLAEDLRDWGFFSGFVGKWHMGREFSTGLFLDPILHGWDLFSGTVSNSGDYFLYDRWIASESVTFETTETKYLTTANVDDALLMAEFLPEPWFITVSFNAAHLPFHEPPQELHSYGTGLTSNQDKYNAAAESLDTELGRLLEMVSSEGALVFLAGDNGTISSVSSTPGRAKATLWEGGINVPLIVAGPGVRTGVDDSLVQATDLYATILELSTSPASAPPSSISFAHRLASSAQPGSRDVAFSQKFQLQTGPQRRQAAREERYKLIRYHDDGSGPQEWFIDLQASPPGEDTVLSSNPASELSGALFLEYVGLAIFLNSMPLE